MTTLVRATPRHLTTRLVVTVRLARPLQLVVVPVIATILVYRARVVGDLAEVLLAAGMAIAVSPCLDDPAATTLAPSPTSPARRAITRLTFVLPAAIVLWVLTRGVTSTMLAGNGPLDRGATWVPSRESWLIIGTFLAVALAVEACTRASGAAAGMTGAGTMVVVVVAMLRLPEQWAMLPAADHWTRWLVLAIAASVLFSAAIADPGRARRSTRSVSRPMGAR